jgi:carotenoid cleavage dioxygenase
MSIDTPAADPNAANPFLHGAYAPVHDEVVVDELEVRGTIPAALRGVYMRNGANPAFPPIGRYHLFDGDGMIHAVELSDGRASYRNRFVQSAGLRVEQREQRALFGGLGEFVMPDRAILDEVGMMKNTANTNVVRHAGRYFALMEAAKPTELTRELATIGEYDFDGALVGAMTAHPKWDPTTGELLFFGYSPLPPYLRYHVADAQGALVRSVDIELPRPVMMHDFVVTTRHVVFFDLPAVFDLESLLGGGVPIRWDADLPARIGVMSREDPDQPTWFELDPFYVFHFLDAWTEGPPGGEQVVVHGCRADRMPVAFGDDVLDQPTPARLHRWTLDLAAGTVAESPVDERPGDFPRTNDAWTGRRRYGYVARSARWLDGTVQFTEVAKHDLDTGAVAVHHYGKDALAGEAAFAPDPEGDAEDDGWLLNFVTDATGTTDLVIVDARDVAGEPVASVRMPRRVPLGFHGNWMPD